MTKVSFDISERQLKALKWISVVRCEKPSESLVHSIEVLGFLLDAYQQGKQIIIQDLDDSRSALIP